ncbi:MAG: zf-HC2 domain-containing protein [Candidatus Dormibacteria bacterium]
MKLTCAVARRLAHDLIDGHATPVEAQRLQAHIATCTSCPPLYQALVALREHLRRHGAAP